MALIQVSDDNSEWRELWIARVIYSRSNWGPVLAGQGLCGVIPPIPLVLSPKKWKNSEWDKLLFYFFKTTHLQWLSWGEFPQRDAVAVHRWKNLQLRFWHLRDGLGSSRSEMWSVPGTCCSHTRNVPWQCCGSTGEFEFARVAGIQAIRLFHTLRSTWLSTRLMDSGSICTNHFHQSSWRCHMTWVQHSEDIVVVVVFVQIGQYLICVELFKHLHFWMFTLLIHHRWYFFERDVGLSFLGLLVLALSLLLRCLSFFETRVLGRWPITDLSHVFHDRWFTIFVSLFYLDRIISWDFARLDLWIVVGNDIWKYCDHRHWKSLNHRHDWLVDMKWSRGSPATPEIRLLLTNEMRFERGVQSLMHDSDQSQLAWPFKVMLSKPIRCQWNY